MHMAHKLIFFSHVLVRVAEVVKRLGGGEARPARDDDQCQRLGRFLVVVGGSCSLGAAMVRAVGACSVLNHAACGGVPKVVGLLSADTTAGGRRRLCRPLHVCWVGKVEACSGVRVARVKARRAAG